MGLPLRKEESVKKPPYKRYHIERPRNHLEKHEVYKMIEGAKTTNSWRHKKRGNYTKSGYKTLRNQLMLLVGFQHGMRNSELRLLRWDHVDLDSNRLSVKRLKNGLSGIHPLWGNEEGGKNGKRLYNEIALFNKLKAESEKMGIISPYVFVNSNGKPMTRDAFYKIMRTLGEEAGTSFPPTPHMLRTGAGADAVNKGIDIRRIQDYLGHKDIRNTVIYTQLNANKFNGFH